ncbi:STAS domain-containing protein [Iamia sp. SCSIO 61187]|uniref:STAS domain-containing protein n=1 Tax=Iamia sp. SCSIO 61187 TaxID=2722752 RepID=UPI001C63278E|nr:STAS domain-containing protein [Iamia sp. SCSIO 61187]QYG92236.1 STAS domain-containing protein [Iamia sp. SCSIO 61187]
MTIGLTLADGTVLVHLAGTLDREARALLLRAARRVVRGSTGHLIVDCADLCSCDEAGLDALASLHRLPGIESVRLRHVDPALRRRLDAAGLAGRLGCRAEAQGSAPAASRRSTL